ncbi:hypothetical protein GUITHDRAFT_151603 [Guillardia theta CCMP2712]|uniref:PDZ domain-containing protein n=1 Tax=Guillardia theta (strain CCMP2712) TaxID=905079 RepID=L1JLQ1_GUITC|nr:hypothetical protein GUITHDRAFT_151603 [Guillardia theta CCMP2712]EKX49065.1 hypothetical protein GUITHDRAFT_151603 [Guillardia theta CCMP2712]|eukprot:XP_005836045.1 hypothetical protein GUITHDRAFT_151603 [Guillardia theta CCMP2712]
MSERRSGNEMAGIGISFRAQVNKQLLIVASMKDDGPAARSGKVRVGDLLETIDGVEVKTTDFEELAHLLLGPEGSTVRLGLRRDGKLINAPIVREILLR